MNLSDIKTTEWLLIQWGRWAYENRGLALDYPSIGPVERMRSTQPPGAMIGDYEGGIVDMAVTGLCLARPKEGEALTLYYLNEETYRGLGKKMGKHHKVVSDLVQGGKMWVEGRLIELL